MQSHYKEKLDELYKKIQRRSQTYIGYPAGADFDYKELYPFLDYNLNNVGDPMVEQYPDMHTKAFEREVIEFFADLFHAPKDNWWGYVTNGGSEGNLYALYVARELYPQGMVYYSEATHYSVQKNIHLLNMDSIVIRTQENGEVDYEDLEHTLQMHRHRPVIIFANAGTTMTEAKDDVPMIVSLLRKFAIKSYYIHSDAALSGAFLPLVDTNAAFDFSAGADSIAVSGHKFIGGPIPCGVVLVKKNYKDRVGKSIPYIGSLDTTITGSRNGITPLFLWYAIRKYGKEGLKLRATECLSIAEYLEKALVKNGIPAWRNEAAITVVFPQPSDVICRKWQLASENGQSHVICMPGITRQQIDLFIHDMIEFKHAGQKAESIHE